MLGAEWVVAVGKLPWCVLEDAGGGAGFVSEAECSDEVAVVGLDGERFGWIWQLCSADFD